MRGIWNMCQATFAAIGGFLAWFLGGMDGMAYVLIALTVTDYVSGVSRAVVERKLSSRIGGRGILKPYKNVRSVLRY